MRDDPRTRVITTTEEVEIAENYQETLEYLDDNETEQFLTPELYTD